MNAQVIPSLDELLADPQRAGGLTPESLATLLARCSAVQSVLTSHLAMAQIRPADGG